MTNASAAANRWRHALLELTVNEKAASSWRRDRYAFAHRLGATLAGGDATIPRISGFVLYGVWLNWGLVHVGQTGEAQRRLRDLAVGESHHLANTFPPEIWSRVVVIEWPRLQAADAVIERLSEPVVGLALEHRLQASLSPLANASRRTAEGGWRSVDWATSSSRGARASGEIDEFFESVRMVWDLAEAWEPGGRSALPDGCRAVFPADLLPGSVKHGRRRGSARGRRKNPQLASPYDKALG